MLENIKITKQEEKDFPVIPEDIYLCEVVDLKEVEGRDYNSGDPIIQIRIDLKVAEGEHKGASLIKSVNPVIGTGFDGGKPSSLYVFLRAVFPDKDFADINLEAVNQAIGKKVRVLAKIKRSQKGRDYNVVADFMKVPSSGVKVESEEIKDSDLPF